MGSQVLVQYGMANPDCHFMHQAAMVHAEKLKAGVPLLSPFFTNIHGCQIGWREMLSLQPGQWIDGQCIDAVLAHTAAACEWVFGKHELQHLENGVIFLSEYFRTALAKRDGVSASGEWLPIYDCPVDTYTLLGGSVRQSCVLVRRAHPPGGVSVQRGSDTLVCVCHGLRAPHRLRA
jgi:hypothetical protein